MDEGESVGEDGEAQEDEEEPEFDPLNTRYDAIDFKNDNYEKWYKEIIKMAKLQGDDDIDEEDEDKEDEEKEEEEDDGEQEDKEEEKYLPKDDEAEFDPEGEVIECVIFNTPDFMCYDYDKISRSTHAKRNFNLEKTERERILGSKNDWNKAISETFFKKPDTASLWEVESDDDMT